MSPRNTQLNYKWRMSRIFKGLARSDYKHKEYLSVLYNSSMLNWASLVGQELNVVYCDRQTSTNGCVYFLSSLSPLHYMLSSSFLT